VRPAERADSPAVPSGERPRETQRCVDRLGASPQADDGCSSDADVPLLWSHHVFSRRNDLNRMAGSGMDGRVQFTGGFDRGCQVGDRSAPRFAGDPAGSWQKKLARVACIVGPGAKPVRRAPAGGPVGEQGRYIVEGSLMACRIGRDPAEGLSQVLVGINFQPAGYSSRRSVP